MKVNCESCQTPFAVSDDLIRGRVVKFRCKRCGGTIRVDGTAVAVADSAGAAEVAAQPSAADRLSMPMPSASATPPPPRAMALSSGFLGPMADEEPATAPIVERVAEPSAAVPPSAPTPAIASGLAAAQGHGLATSTDAQETARDEEEEEAPISMTAFAEISAPPAPRTRPISSAPPPLPSRQPAPIQEPMSATPSLSSIAAKSVPPPPPPKGRARDDGKIDFDDIMRLQASVMPPPSLQALAALPVGDVRHSAPPSVMTPMVPPPASPRRSGHRTWLGAGIALAFALGGYWVITRATASAEPSTTPAVAHAVEPKPQVEHAQVVVAATEPASPNANTNPTPTPTTTPTPTPTTTTTTTTTTTPTPTPTPTSTPTSGSGAAAEAVAARVTATGIPAPKPPETVGGTEAPVAAKAVGGAASDPPAPKPATEAPAVAEGPAGSAVEMAPEFDRAAAVTALGAAVSAAAGCKTDDSPIGVARVSITFAPSGRVTSANVEGPPFAGTSTGGCIAAKFRSAKVPPFSGASVTVHKSVPLN